jgi:hypothetical protein
MFDYLNVLRPGDRARATTTAQARELLLIDLAVIAHSYNSNMLAFDLPEPADAPATAAAISAAHRGVGSREDNAALYATMAVNVANFPEQQDILDLCIQHVTARMQSIADGAAGPLPVGVRASATDASLKPALFIDAAAGCGKTYVLNCITAYLRSVGALVFPSAATGIASIDHRGGITNHSAYGLPLNIDAASTMANVVSSITRDSKEGRAILAADVLIIDEVPMVHQLYLGIIDRLCRDLTGVDDLPFGGKFVICAGDFRLHTRCPLTDCTQPRSSCTLAKYCATFPTSHTLPTPPLNVLHVPHVHAQTNVARRSQSGTSRYGGSLYQSKSIVAPFRCPFPDCAHPHWWRRRLDHIHYRRR